MSIEEYRQFFDKHNASFDTKGYGFVVIPLWLAIKMFEQGEWERYKNYAAVSMPIPVCVGELADPDNPFSVYHNIKP